MIGWLLLLTVVLWLVFQAIKLVVKTIKFVVETIKTILLHVFIGDKITVSEDDLREKVPSWGRVLQGERRIKQDYIGHKIQLTGEGDKIAVPKDDLGEKTPTRRVLQEERRTKQDYSSIPLVWEGDKITVSKDDLGEKAPKGRDLHEDRRTKQDYSSHKLPVVGEGDKITVLKYDLREKVPKGGDLQEERRTKHDYCSHKLPVVGEGDKITVPKYNLGEKAPKGRELHEERRTKQDYSSHKLLVVGEGDKITVPKYDLGEKAPKRRVLQKDKWIKHYCNNHKILLVGEGDFSFSACLAKVFGSASNMVVTSLNSKGFLKKNYCNAISNINGLKSRGCVVLHGVDATTMSEHKSLKGRRFDRIVFNFPYAGFLKNDSRKPQTSGHQKLITGFFENAKKMLSEEGEIHVSHHTALFHSKWDIKSLASLSGLNVLKAVEFNLNDYPGYNTKCGFGGDENFACKPSKTYMFGL
ncbi:hypothetical protein NE237_029169 [Protea cynaroides]|uniref:25S rRNA (uridine-N(3))-methyltransferase BMT5-like domain-containing protein n=1 Tax=Protea cynaroides TaxID=273540 RepID=A0A9Q0JUU2_9MAGN|nr:hypothetical protein NE237_029169 [Protea cynaroides]